MELFAACDRYFPLSTCRIGTLPFVFGTEVIIAIYCCYIVSRFFITSIIEKRVASKEALMFWFSILIYFCSHIMLFVLPLYFYEFYVIERFNYQTKVFCSFSYVTVSMQSIRLLQLFGSPLAKFLSVLSWVFQAGLAIIMAILVYFIYLLSYSVFETENSIYFDLNIVFSWMEFLTRIFFILVNVITFVFSPQINNAISSVFTTIMRVSLFVNSLFLFLWEVYIWFAGDNGVFKLWLSMDFENRAFRFLNFTLLTEWILDIVPILGLAVSLYLSLQIGKDQSTDENIPVEEETIHSGLI